MASTSRPRTVAVKKKPKKKDLPATLVREFRALFDEAKKFTDDQGRKVTSAKWGVYAFYDYDGEPIYVGQTKESLSTRLNRHLTNQRTDAVAMRILDVFEVAELEVWPLWELEDTPAKRDNKEAFAKSQRILDANEYAAYLQAIANSKFGAILNEKIPPVSEPIELPTPYRFPLISDETRAERGHPDVRIARRAETISRLAAVAHERGEVSAGLRRVIVIQAVRLAYKAAERFKFAEGEDAPDPKAISVEGLIGSVLYPTDDEGTGD
ncbi:GIY-YIG nuclease family protein [Nocardioides baculatus]|uniref:GIY-YIG nuclease family protein n=1 Tax=Nocardioides baculatus TaxID=2801337 RepID=A0ABS1LDT7_9ACTN|nr:GIY-YIG nuclease family protein [Nocardioides baculatus]MBL0749795.1 GIY-YIG nuclease family protein [Nocardioides baculatus]